MFTDEELLEFVLKYSKEMGITAYEFGLKTSISHQSADKILSGKTKKPRRRNLLEMMKHIESKKVGTAVPGHKNYDPEIAAVSEPIFEYDKNISNAERIGFLLDNNLKLSNRVTYLEKLLQENNIPFKPSE